MGTNPTDISIFNSGTIVTGNGLPLGSGFSGVMQFFEPMEWPEGSGQYWDYIAFNNDVMTYGVNAADGRQFVAGGAVEQNDEGIILRVEDFTDLIWRDSSLAYPTDTLTISGTLDTERIAFTGYGPNENLLNPSFELGSLTNWTAAGAGTWSIETTNVFHGKYSAKCVLSGTSVHTLTSNRIEIGGGADVALLIVFQKNTLVGWNQQDVLINWYDAPSGGSLLQTDTIDLGNSAAGTWIYKILTTQSPQDAWSCEVVLTVKSTSGTPTIYFDAMRLRTISGSGWIQLLGPIRGPSRMSGESGSTANPNNWYQAFEPFPYFTNSGGQTNPFRLGEHGGAKKWSNSSAARKIVATAVQQDSLGEAGWAKVHAVATMLNSSGAGRTITLTFTFGSYSYSYTSASSASSATARKMLEMEAWIYNDNSTSAQLYRIAVSESRAAAGTAATPSLSSVWDSSTIETVIVGTSKELSISGALSAANVNISASAVGYIEGPYFAIALED